MKTLTRMVRAKALAEGFSKVGICAPQDIPQASARLGEFVEQGFHGQMAWMADRMNWRGDPHQLWPDARSVIMLAESYRPEVDPTAILGKKDRGAISVYAQNRDYHDLVKKRLKKVGRWLLEQAPDDAIKVFVDTAPVMEKPLGQAAGLGWQGKHTNLVSRDLGNWFFLGAIFTTVSLDRDSPETDHCGSCQSCIDVCPTNAFLGPYRLDARKCISYLTIEHNGPVPETLRPALGNRVYGCDDCLAVCPWNKFAVAPSDAGYFARSELKAPELGKLATLDDSGFRRLFAKSPVKRVGRDRFVRNVLYAIGNAGDASLMGVAQDLTTDCDATVRDAAHWAIARLKGG